MKNNDFTDVVQNRHSVRTFDPDVKISHEEFKQMFAETITAPSACDLQAWHFEVADTPETKAKVRKYMMKFNYPQVDTSSAIVQVFGYVDAYKSYKAMWTKTYEEGNITKEKLNEILGTFLPLYENGDYQLRATDAIVDSALASMQFMLVARNHGYDTNPIAGYDTTKVAETFGLDAKLYVPVMAIAIGKSKETPETHTKTVRYPVEQIYHFAE
ncbi:nitroreductase family protein [Lactobacillus sp. ESL0791]|uniref:nitroreductase family protein n=1 Tax=Lactobacillus sp. ESL0791 TaxID=2983234 RepID=UPI0023F72C6A|nr:nitroreductase family protein [Lactobacillus sp. ESL0791]MDF7639737.1 nitroreductase family protein [Lactobacillus sp. ESL0791]